MKKIILTLGTKTNVQYLKSLKKLGTVYPYAEEIIGKVRVSKKKQEVEIALLTFDDLGLTGSWETTQAIKDAAVKRGYALPLAEIALVLFQENMELGDYWRVLHEPIMDSGGDPRVLRADRGDGGRWVRAGWGEPGDDWSTYGAFAFVVPANQPSSLESSALPSDSLDLEVRVARIEAVLKHHNLELP